MKRIGLALVLSALLIGCVDYSSGTASVLSATQSTVKDTTVQGQHYTLNIIGKDLKKGEPAGISKGGGRALFVLANGKTKISVQQDPTSRFEVTDANGLDKKASFTLPTGYYNVFARALGKPGGSADVEARGTFQDAQDGTEELMLGYLSLNRTKGKPLTVSMNKLFNVDATVCTSTNEEGVCDEQTVYKNKWVFNINELMDYFWNYNNDNLKLLQVRFYPCAYDPTGTADNFCRNADGSPVSSSKTVVAM